MLVWLARHKILHGPQKTCFTLGRNERPRIIWFRSTRPLHMERVNIRHESDVLNPNFSEQRTHKEFAYPSTDGAGPDIRAAVLRSDWVSASNKLFRPVDRIVLPGRTIADFKQATTKINLER